MDHTGLEVEDTDAPTDGTDIEAVIAELEELEEFVDTRAERQKVRETMRTVRHVRRPSIVGRFRSDFGVRDAGEALVGSFVFGTPVIVEDGTLEAGRYIAGRPVFLGTTLLLGGLIVTGILFAGEFQRVAEDRLFGVVPVRLVGVVAIACGLAGLLTTIWGRVRWSDPSVAASQVLVVAIVMAVGAAIGDIIPER